MPFVRDKNLVNVYEEIDKANETIESLSSNLKEEEDSNSILKKHRIILGVSALLLLILFLWSFLPKSKQYKEEYLIKNNLSLINTDTLHNMEQKANQITVLEPDQTSLADLIIVYSVQIGAYTNFNSNLISEDLAQLQKFEEGGINKYALGKFTTYKETVLLRDDLRKLGFKDCFIIAKSHDVPVNIKEALELSNEKWVRGVSNP